MYSTFKIQIGDYHAKDVREKVEDSDLAHLYEEPKSKKLSEIKPPLYTSPKLPRPIFSTN